MEETKYFTEEQIHEKRKEIDEKLADMERQMRQKRTLAAAPAGEVAMASS